MNVELNVDLVLRRAQAYSFLSTAFLYPHENWMEELPLFSGIVRDLGLPELQANIEQIDLETLQHEYRTVFGITGSLCYETEIGLPHEFRQSQEMADIGGFYHAFGFAMGGAVHERPDHLAAELEFMGLLALKEAYAAEHGTPEQVEICIEAQQHFLEGHLGCWIALFEEAVTHTASGSLYAMLAQTMVALVQSEVKRLGAEPKPLLIRKPTPHDISMSCGNCEIAQTGDAESDTETADGGLLPR